VFLSAQLQDGRLLVGGVGGWVSFGAGAGLAGTPHALGELLEEWFDFLLSQVQDEFAQMTGEPWPSTLRSDRKPGLPRVGVACRDGVLHGWYGSRDSPVMQLDPIVISDMSGRSSQ
jgi:hypothetical protein